MTIKFAQAIGEYCDALGLDSAEPGDLCDHCLWPHLDAIVAILRAHAEDLADIRLGDMGEQV